MARVIASWNSDRQERTLPIKKGSLLHRALELIAVEVAKELGVQEGKTSDMFWSIEIKEAMEHQSGQSSFEIE